MQISKLTKAFDKLQLIYGDKNLDAIYGAGEIDSPELCLVFMNPTARNISSQKNWKGLKAPWISTKSVWKMLYQLNLFDKDLQIEITKKAPKDWNYDFTDKVYKAVKKRSLYITNLSKATQVDARPLKNKVFKQYLDLFKKEIEIIQPKIIITFGNQVSSNFLSKNIKVSEYRKKYELITINNIQFKVFPIYYPVGQGMRNIGKAKEDIHWILKNYL